MSILMLDRILRDLDIFLSESEKRELYAELSRQFSFIGAYRECERLDELWSDPVYRKAIEEYIRAWLSFRSRRRVMEAYA